MLVGMCSLRDCREFVSEYIPELLDIRLAEAEAEAADTVAVAVAEYKKVAEAGERCTRLAVLGW